MKLARHMLVALSFVVALPAFALEPDISGTYKCTGYDPDSKTSYDTGLVVTKTGETLSFKWKESETEYAGTGLFSKKASNILASEFWNSKNQEKSGVIVYQLKGDTLDGEWTYADKTSVGTETCKKQK